MCGMVLVTGGTGYLGRALVERLLADGERVRVLVRRNRTECGEPVVGDITRPDTLTSAMDGVDTVYHLAALVDHQAGESALWQVNVEGTRNVARAALQAGVRRIVHCSSVSAEPGGGSTPYGRSKIAAEAVLTGFQRHVEIVTLRPGPIYDHERPNLRRVVRAARVLRVVPRLVPDGVVHLASRRNIVDALMLARGRGVAGRAYAICDAAPVARASLTALIARAVGAVTPPLPLAVLVPALHCAALAAGVLHVAFGLRPWIDRGYVRVLARERRYDIGPARVDLGYAPAPTEQHFAEAVGQILADRGSS